MTEQYDTICLVNGDKIESRLFLDEEGEVYQIELKMQDNSFSAEGENYFDALVKLRKKLELHNIKLMCKGCSRFTNRLIALDEDRNCCKGAVSNFSDLGIEELKKIRITYDMCTVRYS